MSSMNEKMKHCFIYPFTRMTTNIKKNCSHFVHLKNYEVNIELHKSHNIIDKTYGKNIHSNNTKFINKV